MTRLSRSWTKMLGLALPGLAFGVSACSDVSGGAAGCRSAADVPALVGDDPLVQIGSTDGPMEYLFRDIGSIRMTDEGMIVVPDRGTNVIRMYDRHGRHVRSFGRVGGGPGEFLALWDAWLSARGDTLFAWDVLGRHISEWSLATGFLATSRLAVDFEPFPLGRFADGTFLVENEITGYPTVAGDIAETQGIVYRLSREGNGPLELLRMPWAALAAGVDSRDGVGVLVTGQPFRAPPRVAVKGDAFFITDGQRYVVYKYSSAGVLLDSLALADEPPVIREEERTAWIDRNVAGTPKGLRTGVRRFLSSLTLPERHAGFTQIIVDDAGYVWSKVGLASSDSASIWAVFDKGGAFVGRTTTPAGFTPEIVGDDMVVGKMVGELDVQSVVILPIVHDPRRREEP